MKANSPLKPLSMLVNWLLVRIMPSKRAKKSTKRYKIIMLWSGGRFRFRYKVRIYDVLEWHYVRQLKRDIATGKVKLYE